MDTKQPILSTTASATFRQLILHVFERLEEANPGRKVGFIGDSARPSTNHKSYSPSAHEDDLAIKDLGLSLNSGISIKILFENDTRNLFSDLCRMLSGETGTWLKVVIQKVIVLELIDSILGTTPKLFLKVFGGINPKYPGMLQLVKDKVCPIILKLVSDKTEVFSISQPQFVIMVRVVRNVKTIVKHYIQNLAMESEIFLSLFCKILTNPTYHTWQRILVLECFKGILGDGSLHRSIFDTFDRVDHSVNIYGLLVGASCEIIFEAKQFLLFYNPSNSPTNDPEDNFAFSVTNSSMRMQCLDQLEKGEAPLFPDTYPIYLAFHSVCSIIEQQYEFIVPIISNDDGSDKTSDILLAIEMVL